MKIEIFDTNLFVEINKLKPVTSPIIFQRGNVPDPNGLLSTEIFGIDVKSRKQTVSYINLKSHFFHPHVYKSMKRLYRNIERIVNGQRYYIINDQGELIEDEANGDTGIEFLYKNWDKIKWQKNTDEATMRNERIDLIKLHKRDEVFTQNMIVVPVFYRDIVVTSSGGGETDPLNQLYAKLIRMVSVLDSSSMFDFTFHATNYQIQNTMVEIYDIFKHKVERKNGMIRKYLMGKNVDNCVRTVISCPLYHDETPEDTPTKFGNAGIPIAQVCSLLYPFVAAWLRDFFEREYIMNKESKLAIDKNGEIIPISIYKPEAYFTDKFIKKMVDRFIYDPESRFDTLKIPVEKDKLCEVAFTGKVMDPSGTRELSTIAARPLTVTDLLYLACYEVSKDKHALITRYPVSDAYGVFVANVSVVSTSQTDVVKINDTIYTHYPRVKIGIKPEDVLINFIDTLQFSNSFLAGLGGDLTYHYQVS